jgi:hypothetical protein
MPVQNNGTNGSGSTTIAQTGVVQNLVPSSIPCVRGDVRAYINNAGDIIVGGNGIQLSPVKGIPIHKDEVYNLDAVTDLFNVLIVGNAGDVIYWNWWTGYTS